MEKVTSHIQSKHGFQMQSNSCVLVRMADYGAVLASISLDTSILGSFKQNEDGCRSILPQNPNVRCQKCDLFIFQADFSELSHSKQMHQPILMTNSCHARPPRQQQQQQLAHLRQAANRCCCGSVASSCCCSAFSDEAIASVKVLRTVPLTSKINTS